MLTNFSQKSSRPGRVRTGKHPQLCHLLIFGAMFLIEGLGSSKAGPWGKMIKEQLQLKDEDIIFMKYHAEHDDDHYDKLRMILSMPQITLSVAKNIVKTAKVVARLYCLQLEELDNY